MSIFIKNINNFTHQQFLDLLGYNKALALTTDPHVQLGAVENMSACLIYEKHLQRNKPGTIKLGDTKSLERLLQHIILGHASTGTTVTGSDRSEIPLYDLLMLSKSVDACKEIVPEQKETFITNAYALMFNAVAHSIIACSFLPKLPDDALEKVRSISTKALKDSKRPEFKDDNRILLGQHAMQSIRHKIKNLCLLTALMPSGAFKESAYRYFSGLKNDFSADMQDFTILAQDASLGSEISTFYQLQLYELFHTTGIGKIILKNVRSDTDPVIRQDILEHAVSPTGESILLGQYVPEFDAIIRAHQTYDTIKNHRQ